MALITAARAVSLIPQLSSVAAEILAAYLDSASNAIEALCHRKFAFAEVVAEPIKTDVYGYAWLARSPVVSGSLVLVDLDDTAIGRWRLDTESGELYVPLYPFRHLKATYEGGYVTLPVELELAVARMARIAIAREASEADGEIASKKIGSVEVTYANIGTIGGASAVPKAVIDTIAHLIMPSPIC